MRLSAARRAAADAPRWRYLLTRDPQRLLEAADRLARDDRADDAVRLLTRANRQHPNVDLATHIVDLRFEAFRQMQWDDEPRRRANVPDLFPGAGIPEVTREELTPERLRSAIAHHGSLLVRGFAGQSDSERLIRDIERAFAACD